MTLASKEVLNEGVRSNLVSRVFLLFGINSKTKEAPEMRLYKLGAGPKKVGIMYLFE